MTPAERAARNKAQKAVNGLRHDFVTSFDDQIKAVDDLMADIREGINSAAPDAPFEEIDAVQNMILPEMVGIKATLETARNVIKKGIK